MSISGERPRSELGQDSPAHYRCVCGTTVMLDETHGGRCPQCERRYSADVLRTAVADTMSLTGIDLMESSGLAPALYDADDPRIGEKLEHFRIVSRLGHGGMGAVYQAVDESLERYVALKVIRPAEGSSDPPTTESDHAPSPRDSNESVRRLVEEARAQARVNHPNVVHIYFVGRDEQTPFFAMELVPGDTLADRLSHGKLSFDKIIEMALQITDALRHAARFDIVHGDIKPSNILLDGDIVKLSDFGLAQRLSRGLTPRGVRGTPYYISPEATLGEKIDTRADMYSLGVMLFEMSFGRLPYEFDSKTPLESLRQHREATPQFPATWPKRLPDGWRSVLTRLLSKRPEDRFEDYEQLAAALYQLRPVELPRAGRLQRGLAWFVDLALTRGIQEPFYAPFMVEAIEWRIDDKPVLQIVAALACAGVALGASWLQMKWGTTPGKKLFQLRIVDRHGLTPSRSRLALRCGMQLLPLWLFSLQLLLAAIGLREVGNLALGAGLACVAIDASFAVFSPSRRSLHDRLLSTQVVLDASVTDKSNRASA